MNPNQYYAPQTNFMPPQTAQPYYQPPAMSPRVPDQVPVSPQSNPVPQFNQPMMTPQVPPAQYSAPQYQYNSQTPNYPPVNAPVQNTQPYQPPPQDMMANQVGVAQPPMQQAYQSSPPNQMPFYPPQNAPNQNMTGSANQYPQGTYNEPAQNAPSSPATNQANFYNPTQADPQQMTYPATTNAANPPQYAQPEAPASTSKQEPPAQYQEPTLEVVPKYKPTNVVGDYKCSDFPNLFTGPFRYSASPVQRKPFTMKGDSHRPTSQPNPSSDRRSQIGLNRNPKRWELRGGKYYGCFTSRTNGLQDNCPKAKCKACPTGERKK